MAARAQDPADLVERGIGVDEVLDHLAEQDGVGGSRRERQPARGEFTAHHVRDAGPGPLEGVLRPVDADDAVAREERRRGGRGLSVAAADVDDRGGEGRGPAERGGERAGLAVGALFA